MTHTHSLPREQKRYKPEEIVAKLRQVDVLISYGFDLGRAAIDICHGKTVCVPHHVTAGKFLGAPWGRKVARHFAGPRRVNAAHSSIPITTSGPAWQLLARQLIGLRFAATLCLRVSSTLLRPCPKYANAPHGGPRAILQLQSLRWSTIATATMSRSESARGGLLRSVEPGFLSSVRRLS